MSENNKDYIKNESISSKLNKLETNEEGIDLKGIYQSIYRKKRILFLITSIIVIFSTFNVIKKRITNPVYQGSFKLLIKDPLGSSGSTGNFDQLQFIKETGSGQDVNTLIVFLKSDYILGKLANEYKISSQSLSNNINIFRGGGSRDKANGILTIQYRDNNLVRGRKILQSLSDTYLNASIEQKKNRLEEGLDFLNQQFPILKGNTSKIQAKLANFREKNTFLTPNSQVVTLKTSQSNLENEILDLEMKNNRLLDVREKIVNGNLSARGFVDSIGGEDGAGLSISDIDQAILTQIINVENELANAKLIFVEDSIVIKGLQARLDKLRPLFVENQIESVNTAISLNKSMIDKTKQERKKLIEKFSEQPLLIKEYENIVQDLEISQQSLLALSSAIQSFQLEMAQEAVPWKLISYPTMSSSPISPNISKGMINGLIVGLAVGLIFAFIRDRFDYVYHNEEEINEDLGEIVIGKFPYFSFLENIRDTQESIIKFFIDEEIEDIKNSEFVQSRFQLQESVRKIASSVKFLGIDKTFKNFTFASSMPAEGKTNVSVIFSIILSQLGYKVLIVDADLRRPQVHKRLGLNNIKGLTTIVRDKNYDIEKVIQKPSKKFENLFVITSGERVLDPTPLISSEIMKNRVEQIKKLDFDYVIYDTAPIYGISDPDIILDYLDGFFLIISLYNINRNIPPDALKNLSRSGFKPIGVITNVVKSDHDEKLNSNRKGEGLLEKNYYYNTYANYISSESKKLDNESTKKSRFLEKIMDSIIKKFKINQENFFIDKLNKLNPKILSFLKWLDG